MINPKEFMIDLKGKQYLPVAPRIVMMREAHPDWAVHTEPVMFGDIPLVMATITDESGRLIATAHKTVVSFRGFDIEKAETGAIGRALSIAGFGTIQAGDMEEGEQIADSPIDGKPASNGKQRGPVGKLPTGITPGADFEWKGAKNWAEFNRDYAEAHPYFKGPEHVFATVKKLYGGVPKFDDVKDELDEALSKYASREADEAAS